MDGEFAIVAIGPDQDDNDDDDDDLGEGVDVVENIPSSDDENQLDGITSI